MFEWTYLSLDGQEWGVGLLVLNRPNVAGAVIQAAFPLLN